MSVGNFYTFILFINLFEVDLTKTMACLYTQSQWKHVSKIDSHHVISDPLGAFAYFIFCKVDLNTHDFLVQSIGQPLACTL